MKKSEFKKLVREIIQEMNSIAWDVFLNGKLIDTVWDQEKDPEEVRRSLINHDGYDNRIKVKKSKTKI